MEDIFVDASFLVSLLNKNDPNHQKAVGVLEKLDAKSITLFINFIVIAEATTVVSQQVGKKEAAELLEEYRQGAYVEIEIDNEAKERALEIFAGQKSKNLPFFDAIHFATIEKLGIKKVLGFDKHFEKFGFELVK